MRNILNENVLVLNRLWQAINVCTVERAFTLLYMGHAEVVTENAGNFQTFDFHEWRDITRDHPGDDVVRTVSFKIKIPRENRYLEERFGEAYRTYEAVVNELFPFPRIGRRRN